MRRRKEEWRTWQVSETKATRNCLYMGHKWWFLKTSICLIFVMLVINLIRPWRCQGSSLLLSLWLTVIYFFRLFCLVDSLNSSQYLHSAQWWVKHGLYLSCLVLGYKRDDLQAHTWWKWCQPQTDYSCCINTVLYPMHVTYTWWFFGRCVLPVVWGRTSPGSIM